MNSIVEYFNQAQLALAAYATLTPGVDPVPALQDSSVGMAPTQAAVFASNWTVLAPTFTDPATGVSATVFRNNLTGQATLAIRGTEITDLGDLTADGGILLHGIPDLSGQYQSLHAKVAEENIGSDSRKI